ncbi:MAG: tetratricopeptide repeat protein [Bacteroidetes bacterium]|nr:MAG: tetratricopeptide repeat protein [Bacteroidota bacterium]
MKCWLTIIALFTTILAPAQERGITPAEGTKTAQTGTTRAVVVGISDYQDDNIPDLRFADRDATAFAAYLQSPAGGLLPPENVNLLTNKAATTGAIAAAMDWLIADCKAGDRAIIYFSGHGDVETRTKFQRGFLLTYDSPPSNYLAGAFALIFLQDIISTLADQGVQVVMISDACRAGKLAGSDIGGAQATAANLSRQFANEIKILSCQPDEFSLEGEQWGGGRGCFSYHLIEGLTGLADGNADKQVNLLEIGQYLQTKVPAETAPQSQIPLTVGSMKTVLTDVDEASLLALREQKEKSLPVIATIETKGFETVLLAGADSIWQKKYKQFTTAVQKGDLLEPAGASAYDLYTELSNVPELERLHGIMKRNLATALQDESQQAINAYLRSDEEEIAAQFRGDLKYTKFVRYLEKAAELLGEDHYMYKTLKAKQYYFDAVDIRIRFTWRTFSLADSSLIWDKQCEDLIRKALELEENAAFIYFEQGLIVNNDTSYYKKAIELAPAWAMPYGQIIVPLVVAGKMEEAESYAAKLMAMAPESSFAYATSGWLHLVRKNYEQAEQTFLKALGISPRNVGWLKYLAWAYFVQKKYQDAEKTWLRVLELSPNDNETYNELSGLYVEHTNEFEKGIAINLQRLKMRPTDGDAYADLLDAYRKSDQPDKIPAMVEEMKRLDAIIENWEGTLVLGEVLFYDMGQKEEGMAVLKKGIRNAPESGWGYYLLANQYRDIGDYETALAYIDTAFSKRINLEYIERYSDVPQTVRSPGYLAYVQKWMAKFPDWGFCQSLMGVYFDEKKDWEKALEYHKKAVELNPESEFNWFYYACSAYRSGQQKTADSLFQKYLSQTLDLADSYNRISYFYAHLSDFKKAEDFSRKAFDKDPSRAGEYYYNQSCLQSLQGNSTEAFDLLETALKNGYKNYQWMQLNSDLTTLRALPEWKVLMKKYFPDQATN